ncbi:S24 family peptidase [Pedobacter sp.]|uniref:S24 family peptidase n=1 Tax=Pedobacter sp. TaxID=1411316 RepID=UPI0031DBE308
MQTILKNNSNIFERMMALASSAGCKNANELSKHLGYKSPEKLYRLERDKDAKPSADILIDFADKFDNVNMNWVLTGLGEPYYSNNNTQGKAASVPYYNFDLNDSDITNLTLMEEKPEYFVNYRPFNDCTAYLPVFGDSMYPKYASGEIVAVKEITNFDVIQWGEAYVIMTGENTNSVKSIKLLHEHPDPNKIILRSSNPNFKGDTILYKKDISSLYIIKGKITRNMI